MISLLPLARLLVTPSALRRRVCAFGLFAAVALPFAFAQRAHAEDADSVVARVNGIEITASDIAIAEEDVGASMSPMTGEARRDYLTTYVADMLLVAKAAEGRKIADGKEFKQRLAYYRNKILMEMILQSEAKAAISDTALHKLYGEATKQMTGEKEVRARHILVATEDEAKTVLAELKSGGDFAQLAKQKSKDPGAAEGGDLGYFTKDQMVPEFAEVAFRLDTGQLSDPVKTQFGWHIIKVEDRRDRPVPEFDKVRDQLENFLVRKAQADLITKLRAEGKVERLGTKPDKEPAAEPSKK